MLIPFLWYADAFALKAGSYLNGLSVRQTMDHLSLFDHEA